MKEILLYCIVLVILIHSSYTDIKRREIEHYHIMALLVVSIGYSIYIQTFLYNIVFFILFFVIGYILFNRKMWGGGDSKLLSVIGLILSIPHNILYIVYFLVLFTVILLVGGAIYDRLEVSKRLNMPIAPVFLVAFLAWLGGVLWWF